MGRKYQRKREKYKINGRYTKREREREIQDRWEKEMQENRKRNTIHNELFTPPRDIN